MQYQYSVSSMGVDQVDYTDEVYATFPLERIIYNGIVLPPTQTLPERTIYDIELN